MAKRIFNSLSFKVFIISFLIQIISGALICTVLYMKTPPHTAIGEVADLVLQLGECTRDEAEDMVDGFIDRTGMDIAVYVEYGTGFSFFKEEYIISDFGGKTLKSVEEVRRVFEDLLEDEYGPGSSAFHVKDDFRDYVLVYFDHGTMLNTMNDSIRESLPLVVTVVVALSFVNSFIFVILFARPVKKLSRYSRAMAELDFGTRCPVERNDEIGELAQDLNSMSEALEGKIRELQEEIVRVQQLESQKETFFAAASHELKTPVAILEGNLRGMIEGLEPYNDRDEYLSRSFRVVKRMERLINEILTASKMQSASGITLDKVDMGKLVGDKTGEMDDLFTIRDIIVTKDLESGTFVNANAELTSLAVGAFISNAVFYSAEGEKISISVSLEGDSVITKIRNTNAHISEKDLEHLFEAFYRSDSSRSRNTGGSGLGLYIARLIVTKQGGQCSLENDGDDVLAVIKLKAYK